MHCAWFVALAAALLAGTAAAQDGGRPRAGQLSPRTDKAPSSALGPLSSRDFHFLYRSTGGNTKQRLLPGAAPARRNDPILARPDEAVE
jgi:hypothetical protein